MPKKTKKTDVPVKTKIMIICSTILIAAITIAMIYAFIKDPNTLVEISRKTGQPITFLFPIK